MYAQRCFWCLRQHSRLFSTSSVDSDLPRITVPHKMMRKIERRKLVIAQTEHKNKKRGPLVISCKKPQLNHHIGQTYPNFKPHMLASAGWMKGKSKGDHFTINAFRSNPALTLPEGIKTFHDVGLNQDIVSALNQNGMVQPTNIQALAIPSFLEGNNVLCAAETGSGKTLAYLLPIYDKIYRYNKKYGPIEHSNQPHGVVVMPSRELADQAFAVAVQVGDQLGMRIHSICGGRGTQLILRERPQAPVDLLICTPGVLSKLLTNSVYQMNNLKNIVLDEADTLLDDSFNALTLRILRKLKITSEIASGEDEMILGTQIALVGATIPRSLDTLMNDIVPVETIDRIITTHTHRLMPHVTQKFYRCMPSTKHDDLVLQLLKLKQKKEPQPAIVFCNRTSTTHFVSNLLNDHNIPHVHMHANMNQNHREGLFEKFQEGQVDVLVATDIASRGLDTCRAKHIINYEFPSFMSDYIHRVGRTGRVGSEGTGVVHSYVTQKWEVDLLWKIETAARKMSELHNVNANIKRKLQGMQEEKEMAQIAAEEESDDVLEIMR